VLPPRFRREQVVEDFLRNFLLKSGMHRTLSAFQTEWYEMVQRGIVDEAGSDSIPDCYARNNQLLEQIEMHTAEKEALVAAAARAAKTHTAVRAVRTAAAIAGVRSFRASPGRKALTFCCAAPAGQEGAGLPPAGSPPREAGRKG